MSSSCVWCKLFEIRRLIFHVGDPKNSHANTASGPLAVKRRLKCVWVSYVFSMQNTVLTQIKRMIQSSARNSILGIYGWIQLKRKSPLINSGLIQFSATPGMKPFSCPYFVATRGGQEQFPGKRVYLFLRSDDVAILAALFCVATTGGRRLQSPQTSMTAG